MKHIILYTCTLAIIAVTTSCGNNASDSKEVADSTNNARIDKAKDADTVANSNNGMADMQTDADFATKAADGGMLEVTLGKLAVERGVSPAIKKLGAMMVKDHSKANEELKALAASKNIALPAALSEKCQKIVADLQEKKGADFDKAYADLMVSDHKEDIDDFKKEADKGNDSDVKLWAQGKVPVLEHHLMEAENTQKVVEKK